MILVIDNYDSFTWNLVHYLMELGAKVEVVRNDAISAGKVGRGGLMHGKTSPVRHDGTGLFAGLPSPFTATRYHSLIVEDIPADLVVNATSEDGSVMGFRHATLPIHSVQFHPESIATEHGHDMLANFMKIAGIPVREREAA
mgnify:CR=1 FL=1